MSGRAPRDRQDDAPAVPPSEAVQAGPRDDAPVIPERSRDDQDTGWGETGDDDERYLRERPPHW